MNREIKFRGYSQEKNRWVLPIGDMLGKVLEIHSTPEKGWCRVYTENKETNWCLPLEALELVTKEGE